MNRQMIYGEKVTVEICDLGAGLRIRMSTNRSCWMIPATAMALGGVGLWSWCQWAFGLKSFGRGSGLFATVAGARALLATLLWVVVSVFVVSVVIQMLMGAEIITLTPQRLTRRVWPIGWRQEYFVDRVSNLRLDSSLVERLASRFYGGRESPPLPVTPIAFDYNGKTIRLATILYEPEARQVLELLRRWVSERQPANEAD